jgi:hypothetical protein
MRLSSGIAPMIDLGRANEDDVVLAFLQAEIDSARFGSSYASILANSGLSRHLLIDQPDRASPRDNSSRAELLKRVRGYGCGQLLFAGLPTDVAWRRVSMEQKDFSKLRYAKCPPWIELSGGTRLVTEGAKNVAPGGPAEDAALNIRAVVADLKSGKRYPDLIGVEGQNGDIILMEGHTRATAYVVSPPAEPIGCIVGSSPTMTSWAFY